MCTIEAIFAYEATSACAVAVTPARMHRSDFIAAQPFKRLKDRNPEGRPCEDESLCSGDSMLRCILAHYITLQEEGFSP